MDKRLLGLDFTDGKKYRIIRASDFPEYEETSSTHEIHEVVVKDGALLIDDVPFLRGYSLTEFFPLSDIVNFMRFRSIGNFHLRHRFLKLLVADGEAPAYLTKTKRDGKICYTLSDENNDDKFQTIFTNHEINNLKEELNNSLADFEIVAVDV